MDRVQRDRAAGRARPRRTGLWDYLGPLAALLRRPGHRDPLRPARLRPLGRRGWPVHDRAGARRPRPGARGVRVRPVGGAGAFLGCRDRGAVCGAVPRTCERGRVRRGVGAGEAYLPAVPRRDAIAGSARTATGGQELRRPRAHARGGARVLPAAVAAGLRAEAEIRSGTPSELWATRPPRRCGQPARQPRAVGGSRECRSARRGRDSCAVPSDCSRARTTRGPGRRPTRCCAALPDARPHRARRCRATRRGPNAPPRRASSCCGAVRR